MTTSMSTSVDAVRAEWVELTTVRSTAVLLGASALIGLAISWSVAVFVTDEVLLASEVLVYSAVLTALLASIGGILAITTELQHGTLPAALMAHPTRWPVILATVAGAAALGLALGVVGLVCSFAGAVIGGLGIGTAGQIAVNGGWALVFTTMSAVLGVGIGMAVWHSTGAISGLLAWWLVLENLLLVSLPGPPGPPPARTRRDRSRIIPADPGDHEPDRLRLPEPMGRDGRAGVARPRASRHRRSSTQRCSVGACSSPVHPRPGDACAAHPRRWRRAARSLHGCGHCGRR